jgi:hypothetical protein
VGKWPRLSSLVKYNLDEVGTDIDQAVSVKIELCAYT